MLGYEGMNRVLRSTFAHPLLHMPRRCSARGALYEGAARKRTHTHTHTREAQLAVRPALRIPQGGMLSLPWPTFLSYLRLHPRAAALLLYVSLTPWTCALLTFRPTRLQQLRTPAPNTDLDGPLPLPSLCCLTFPLSVK